MLSYRTTAVALTATALLAGGTTAATTAAAQGAVIRYGDKLTLANQWTGGGGYLDTRGLSSTPGAKLAVSTSTSPNRDRGSGTWRIVSATGKANGTAVRSGDKIHLMNQWNNGQGGYLDTNTFSNRVGAKLNVSTTASPDRARAGTGTWRIFALTSDPKDGNVRSGDKIHLLNGWTNAGNVDGGFLDTNGRETNGNLLAVSTSYYADRGNGTGTWKVTER